MFGGGLGDVEDDPEGDEPEVDEPEGVVGAVSVVVVVLGALVVSGLVVLVGSLGHRNLYQRWWRGAPLPA